MKTNEPTRITEQELAAMSGAELREAVDYFNSHSAGMPDSEYRAGLMVFVDEINRRGERIAKKYKKKYRPLSYSELRKHTK